MRGCVVASLLLQQLRLHHHDCCCINVVAGWLSLLHTHSELSLTLELDEILLLQDIQAALLLSLEIKDAAAEDDACRAIAVAEEAAAV